MASEAGFARDVSDGWTSATGAKLSFEKKPLINAQSRAKSRKMIPPSGGLTTGIHGEFRGLKFEPDAELVRTRVFIKGFKTLLDFVAV